MKDLVALIQEQIPEFTPNDNDIYTFRYVFKQKGSDKVGFIHVSGLWETHVEQYSKVLESSVTESCFIEYLGHFDCRFVGIVVKLKQKKDSEVESNE